MKYASHGNTSEHVRAFRFAASDYHPLGRLARCGKRRKNNRSIRERHERGIIDAPLPGDRAGDGSLLEDDKHPITLPLVIQRGCFPFFFTADERLVNPAAEPQKV